MGVLRRIIPCLLINSEGLVKTMRFNAPHYLGDPINAVRIFNTKEVDEIIILDIDAPRSGSGPRFGMIEELASECFMPLAYGGGIQSVSDAAQLFRMGVEKIIVNSICLTQPDLVKELTNTFAQSSIVGAMDIKTTFFGKKQAYTQAGKKSTKMTPVAWATYLESLGVGEIFVNSIDHDGEMNGYDIESIKLVADAVRVPVVCSGGAGSLDDIRTVFTTTGVSGAAAGSIFVYHGKEKGILIDYPKYDTMQDIRQL